MDEFQKKSQSHAKVESIADMKVRYLFLMQFVVAVQWMIMFKSQDCFQMIFIAVTGSCSKLKKVSSFPNCSDNIPNCSFRKKQQSDRQKYACLMCLVICTLLCALYAKTLYNCMKRITKSIKCLTQLLQSISKFSKLKNVTEIPNAKGMSFFPKMVKKQP